VSQYDQWHKYDNDEWRFLAALGKRIRARRKELGISRHLMEFLADTSRTTLYCIEHGTRQMNVLTLRKYANALNVTSDFILYGDESND